MLGQTISFEGISKIRYASFLSLLAFQPLSFRAFQPPSIPACKRREAPHSTTHTVQFLAWLTILLETLPNKNSSLLESPCLPTTMVL